MALTQITYNDKSNYQVSALANEYKISGSDMNEIKSVVNDTCTQVDNSIGYSTTETAIGTWIDGKTIYRKVVDTGALPNATVKNVAHNISNLDFVTSLRIVAYNSTYKYFTEVPMVDKTNVTYQVSLYLTLTNIVINAGDNKSGYNKSYAIIEYTKTS